MGGVRVLKALCNGSSPTETANSNAYKNRERRIRRPGLYHRKWARLLSSVMTMWESQPSVLRSWGFVCLRRSHLLPT